MKLQRVSKIYYQERMVLMAGSCIRCEYFNGSDWCDYWDRMTQPSRSCGEFSPEAPVPTEECPKDDDNDQAND